MPDSIVKGLEFVEQFQDSSRRDVLWRRIAFWAGIIAMMSFILPLYKKWNAYFAFLPVLAIAVSVFARTRGQLRCPACNALVLGKLTNCCPECGRILDPCAVLGTRACSHCRTIFRPGKRRAYKMRFCSNCSSHLSDRGI